MDRALKANGEKPVLLSPRIQSLAIQIAVEIAKQDNDVDNLGDGESIVLMSKCPTINLVQLAERIDYYREAEVMALQRRIESLELDLELAQHDATEGADAR